MITLTFFLKVKSFKFFANTAFKFVPNIQYYVLIQVHHTIKKTSLYDISIASFKDHFVAKTEQKRCFADFMQATCYLQKSSIISVRQPDGNSAFANFFWKRGEKWSLKVQFGMSYT